MKYLQAFFPLAVLVAAGCSSTDPGATGGNASSTSSSSSSSSSGPIPDGLPEVLIPSRVSTNFGQHLALSRDGKVLVVSALSGGQLTDPDADRFPVYAFEAPTGAFSPVCQLPGLQNKDVGRQGDLLSLNGDGTILAMHEWLGNPAVVTLLERTKGCWSRTGFQKKANVNQTGDFDAISVSSDGTTVIAGSSRNTLDPNYPKLYRSGLLSIWATSGDDDYFSPVTRRWGAFGTSAVVSADGSLAFVGEPQFAAQKDSYPQGEPVAHGSAYVLDLKNHGAALATLNASNWAEQAGFGKSIAASADGRYILVGAPNEKSLDEAGTQMSDVNHSGAVYLFEKEGSTWMQRHMFKPENPAEAFNGGFGQQTAISDDGNTVVIGASFYKTEPAENIPSGAVYIFKRGASDSWTHRVLDGVDYPQAGFGTTFALDGSGKRLVVGAPFWHIEKPDASGAVLIYAL